MVNGCEAEPVKPGVPLLQSRPTLLHGLGVSRTVLHRLAKEEGFFFRRHDKERQRREAARKVKAEQEAKLVGLIRANSGKGLSRNFVAKQLGISSHYLVSLAKKNGIDFPRRSDRT